MSTIPDHIYKTVELLESRIGYVYKKKEYAINALVHSSFRMRTTTAGKHNENWNSWAMRFWIS